MPTNYDFHALLSTLVDTSEKDIKAVEEELKNSGDAVKIEIADFLAKARKLLAQKKEETDTAS